MSPPRAHPGLQTGARVWLVRHAEVDAAWQGRAYGDLDVPLSPEGLEATAAMGRAFHGLPIAAVLASPLDRAARMGRSIADATGAPLATHDGLREIFRGAWQGRPTEELGRADPEGVAAYYADPWSYAGHGGETDERILARALPALVAAAEAHPQAHVVLATHYNVIRVLLAHALGVAPARSFALRVDPGRACLLADEADGWVLHALNVLSPPAEMARA